MNIVVEKFGETVEYSNMASFNGGVLDGEAWKITSNGVLSSFHLNDVLSVLKLLITKCHKGGVISIIEHDMYRISKEIVENPIQMDAVNNSFSTYMKYCCFLTLPYLEFLVDKLNVKDVRIIGKEITSSGKFILTLQRDK